MLRTKDYITIASALRTIRERYTVYDPPEGRLRYLPEEIESDVVRLIDAIATVAREDDPWFDETRFRKAVLGGMRRNHAWEFWGQVGIGFIGTVGALQLIYEGCLPYRTGEALGVIGAISAIALWRWWHDIFGVEARHVRRLLVPPSRRPMSPAGGGGL
jgi:hypothetical protein